MSKIRSVVDVLRQLRQGKTLDLMSEQFNELIKVVNQTGKQGTITLKLTVKPEKTQERMVSVRPDISLILPKEETATLFYSTEDNNLQRDNPDNVESDELIKSVPDAGYKELKEVSGE